MNKERISHMESCLLCGSTGSGAVDKNQDFEELADKFIQLAARAKDHAALKDFAASQIERMGVFSTTGHAGSGPSALYRLRRAKIAQKALAAMVDNLEPIASDEHRFDGNGHLI